MKKCSACKATKPLKEFYIYHPVSGGKRRTYHRGICKKCILASDKEKRKDPKVKKKLYEYQMAYFKRNYGVNEKFTKRVKASSIFGWHLSNGKIKKQPCEMCGCDKVHGHHDNYDKPFDVRWLCSKHHRKVHKELLSLTINEEGWQKPRQPLDNVDNKPLPISC